MTSAARPTFYPKVGDSRASTFKSHNVSAKDLSSYTKLKFRQPGQNTLEEIASKNFKSDIDAKEKLILESKDSHFTENLTNETPSVKLLTNISHEDQKNIKKYENLDADVEDDNSDDDFDSSSDEEEDDDDDDEMELQAELERIKAERMTLQAKKELEERELDEKTKRDSALKGNPLLNLDGNAESAKIKRKWNDDVVFRNQARDESDQKKRFINDTVRNDFHRLFLKKYQSDDDTPAGIPGIHHSHS